MSEAVDLYAVLGLARDATVEQVRGAYRRAAKGAHPDAGGLGDRWALVSLAHAVLGDALRRERYDRTGEVVEAQPDNRMALAMGVISQALDDVRRRMAGGGMLAGSVDVVAMVRARVDGWRSEGERELMALGAEVLGTDRLRGRFEVEGESNFMEVLVLERARQLSERRVLVGARLEQLSFALRLLEGVRYRLDAGVVQVRMVF